MGSGVTCNLILRDGVRGHVQFGAAMSASTPVHGVLELDELARTCTRTCMHGSSALARRVSPIVGDCMPLYGHNGLCDASVCDSTHVCARDKNLSVCDRSRHRACRSLPCSGTARTAAAARTHTKCKCDVNKTGGGYNSVVRATV